MAKEAAMPEPAAMEARSAAMHKTVPAAEATTEPAPAEATAESAAAEAATEATAAEATAETTAAEATAETTSTAAVETTATTAAEATAAAVSAALRKGVAWHRCDGKRCRKRQCGYCFTDHGSFPLLSPLHKDALRRLNAT